MSAQKEAKARIKINNLLQQAGWRFESSSEGPANIQLELHTTISITQLTSFGDDFENVKPGFIDYLLLDPRGFPLVVLEAKREHIDPLTAKEQARAYALAVNARFIILSNGNLHYFWDLTRGNPEVITAFPTQESIIHRSGFKPNNARLSTITIDENYIAESINPNFQQDPSYSNTATREQFLKDSDLPILRPYQVKAVQALQHAAANNADRYLFEMATGTGKTLISAAVIKLFLRSGNAKRVLFLVDRLELEDQAFKNFVRYLKNDYIAVIYKQNRDDWRKAEIVITTVQSLSSQAKYQRLFSPTDFDLVISDEAHRSINGNSRAVFEYFIGYKLGLTATPKDYLKHIDPLTLPEQDPRAWERRQLLDTYTTFGCPTGEPTYRYSLLDGVRDGYLINPIAIDARTDITTQLLSEKGYSVIVESDEGETSEESFFHRDFERKFFSEKTNLVFCQTILQHANRDPLTNEIGKTIVFCVSQKHATKITQILNQLADGTWPGKYNSDFAVQITSNVPTSQQMSISFANNNLNGATQFLPAYRSSKTRVCVTVGMMTTGYDCSDLLNLALLRPVFSPSDFIQIKGRGTRTFTFNYKDVNGQTHTSPKQNFKFFDFFANFEYFEEKFNYDEAIKLPQVGASSDGSDGDPLPTVYQTYETLNPDQISTLSETAIGIEGMKIDRMLFEKAREVILKDTDLSNAVQQDHWEEAIRLLRERYENRPDLYLNLDKLRKAENLDRRLTWREFLERVFGVIQSFPTRDELINNEVQQFIAINKPTANLVPTLKNFFNAFLTDPNFRHIIETGRFADLAVYSGFNMRDLQTLGNLRATAVNYIKDYVPINQFMN